MGEARRKAMSAVISVLIPERGRPAELERLICSLLDTAGDDDNIEILAFIDNDDPAWQDREPLAHSRVRYLRRDRPVTLGEKLNVLARECRGEVLWFISNDQVVETKSWPATIRDAVRDLPNGIGVLYAQDPLHPDHASYPILTRRLVERAGFFMPPFYPYWWVDTHWTEVGLMLGLLREVPVRVSSPDGRGKCHGLVDLPFWVRFFEAMRALRVRDAESLAQAAWGDGPQFAQFQKMLEARASICARRTAHLSNPDFLNHWSAQAASPPSPAYPEVKAYAERLLKDLEAQQPRPAKVFICVPSGRTWEATTANCVAAMSAYSVMAGVDVAMLNVQSSMIAHGRNSSVQLALEGGADFILFVDSDLKFPPDTLVRLLSHQKDICGATYNRRVKEADGSYRTLGKFLTPAEGGEGLIGPLHEAQLLPGGMVLVKADVYRKLGWPWYAEAYRWEAPDGLSAFKAMLRDYYADEPPTDVLDSLDGSALGDWIMTHNVMDKDDHKGRLFSEDYFLMRKARRAGFRIWCDLALTNDLSHLGEHEVTCRMSPEMMEKIKPAA